MKRVTGDVSLLHVKLVSESIGDAQRFPGARMELDGKAMWLLDTPTVIRRKAGDVGAFVGWFSGINEVVYR